MKGFNDDFQTEIWPSDNEWIDISLSQNSRNDIPMTTNVLNSIQSFGDIVYDGDIIVNIDLFLGFFPFKGQQVSSVYLHIRRSVKRDLLTDLCTDNYLLDISKIVFFQNKVQILIFWDNLSATWKKLRNKGKTFSKQICSKNQKSKTKLSL